MPSDNKANPAKDIKLRPSLKSFWAAWIFFILCAMAALAPGAVIDVTTALSPQLSDLFGSDPSEAQKWVLLVGALTAIGIGGRYIAYPLLANRYFITRDSVVEVYGIIKKERKSTKFEHILTVNEDIGYIGRLLGFGDIVFFTAGSGGEDIRLNSIDNPGEIAEQIQERADKASASTGSTHSTEVVEAVSRHQSQIDRLIQKVDELAEKNAQLREHVAVLSFRIGDTGIAARTASADHSPVADTPESVTTTNDQPHEEPAQPSDQYTYQENPSKLFPASDAEALDIDDFSDQLDDPVATNTAIAQSTERRPFENPRHDEDGNPIPKAPAAESPRAQETSGAEFTGLMARTTQGAQS